MSMWCGSAPLSAIAFQMARRASCGTLSSGKRPKGCIPTPTTNASVMSHAVDRKLPASEGVLAGAEFRKDHPQRRAQVLGESPRVVSVDAGVDHRAVVELDPRLDIRDREAFRAALGEDVVAQRPVATQPEGVHDVWLDAQRAIRQCGER